MSRYIFKTLSITVFAILIIGIFLSGCTSTKTPIVKAPDEVSNKAPENTPTEPVTPPDSTQSVKLTLYFPNADASGLIATERTVVVTNQETIKAMFTELATPPTGMDKPLPQGTKLLGATVNADGVASIDLSTEFQKNFGGGSAGEQMTMYSIVNTLTTLPDIKSVQFMVDGKKHDGILGHLDTSTPLTRNESLIVK